MSGQRHSYADHPAALILADHRAYTGWSVTSPARCDCGEWRGPSCDHPAHLADMLHRAGLLADGTPPETPTTRVLAERADRQPRCCNAHHFEGCADGEPGCCPRCSINPWPAERANRRTT